VVKVVEIDDLGPQIPEGALALRPHERGVVEMLRWAFHPTELRGQKNVGARNLLERFADVEPGLDRLQQAGHTMVVFSNGSPRMLEPLMDSAGLNRWFDGFLSVDPVRAFKPSPRTYRYVADELGRPIGEIRLISSNPFDVVGAHAAGMQAAWINRSGGPFDTLRPPPHVVVGSLVELADTLCRPT